MQNHDLRNALLISIDEKPFCVIPVHRSELWTIPQILDCYSENFDLPREKMSGQWIRAFDITKIVDGVAAPIAPAENNWNISYPNQSHLG
jgi:hypothetical protein